MSITYKEQPDTTWTPDMRFLRSDIVDGHWWDLWYKYVDYNRIRILIACELHGEYLAQEYLGVASIHQIYSDKSLTATL